jgi:hypothetical protein
MCIRDRVLGLSGDDGSKGSYHLHWEVRDNDGFGTTGTINPLKYMAGVNFKESTIPPPRGNDSGWEYNPNSPPRSRVPNNAVRLPNGKYLVNGRVGDINNPNKVTEAKTQYGTGNPVRTGSIPSNQWNGRNDPGKNYGYAYLAKNPNFTKKLAVISSRLGTSAQWLADIMAFETGNFTKMGHHNSGAGAVGLIGFTESFAREMNTSTYSLAQLSPERQLDYVYKYLNRPNIKPHLGKGVEYVASSIFGGAGLLNKMVSNRERALNIGDNNIKMEGYLEKLGRDVGRRYDVRGGAGRARRLSSSAVHSGYHDGCATCAALRASGSEIVPHQIEYTT